MSTDEFATRRYCAIFLPLLSADTWLRNHPGQLGPRAFVARDKGAMRIMAVDEMAEALGITPGMALADARARLPDLQTTPYDAAGDARWLEEIADSCDRFTPSIALDPPDGLTLDITGCAHLWGGEAGLMSALAAHLVQLGLTLRLALAETPDKARALARHGGDMLRVGRKISPRNLNETGLGYQPQPEQAAATSHATPLDVLDLPVDALGLAEDKITALRRAGLRTLDDLAMRPRAPLAARFGQATVARLARILGEDDARITPRRVPPDISVTQRFAEPVGHSDILRATLHELAGEAGQQLAQRGQGARAFLLMLFRSDSQVQRLAIATGQPTRDPDLVLRLFQERIETLADPLDPGFGYDLIRLDISETDPLGADQLGLTGKDNPARSINLLTDRLSVRLGAERIRRFAAADSHIPECAGFTVPVARPVLPLADHGGTLEAGEPPLRPMHLMDPPQIVQVIAEVPDGPPRRFRWRRQVHDITAYEGPERLSAEWWKRRDGAGLTRDYYRVEDSAGRRFWLFRHGLYEREKDKPDWYLHGLFG